MRVCLLCAKDGTLGAEQVLRAAAWCVLYDVPQPEYLCDMPEVCGESMVVVARNRRRDALYEAEPLHLDPFAEADALYDAAVAELLPFVRRALAVSKLNVISATIDAVASVHNDRQQALLIEATEPSGIRYMCTGQRYSDAVIEQAGRCGTLNFYDEPAPVTVFAPCRRYRAAFDGAVKITLPGGVDTRAVDEDVYWKVMRWRTLWWWPWGGHSGDFPRWLMPTTVMK